MDRLLMSLDDIMAAKNKEFKEKAANKRAANNTKVGNMKTNMNKNNTNQRSTPYLETNPSRSIVIPIIKKVPINHYVDDRPVVKIIQPTPQPQQMIVTKTVVKKPIEQKAATTAVSVFARLGKQPVSGTRVTFDNLQKSVTISDLRELSAAIGEVKDIEFSQSVSSVGGKGKKVAVVLFARRSDALSCIEKYNGLTLDNSLLEVSLTEESGSSSLVTQQVATAPKTVFDRLQQGRKVTHNVKAGLFGTAIENDEDDDDGQEGYEQQQVVTYAHHGEYVQQDEDGNDGQVQFAVTMNKHQHSSSSTKVVQPYRQVVYHDNRNNSGTYNGRNQPYTHNGGNNRPNNNNNKRSNSNNKKGAAKQVVSSVDLDNDLDSYFAAK